MDYSARQRRGWETRRARQEAAAKGADALAAFDAAHKRERTLAVRASSRRQHVRNRGEPATATAKAISAARLRAQAAKDAGPEAWAAHCVQKEIERKAKAAIYGREHRARRTETMRALRRRRALYKLLERPSAGRGMQGRPFTPVLLRRD